MGFAWRPDAAVAGGREAAVRPASGCTALWPRLTCAGLRFHARPLARAWATAPPRISGSGDCRSPCLRQLLVGTYARVMGSCAGSSSRVGRTQAVNPPRLRQATMPCRARKPTRNHASRRPGIHNPEPTSHAGHRPPGLTPPPPALDSKRVPSNVHRLLDPRRCADDERADERRGLLESVMLDFCD